MSAFENFLMIIFESSAATRRFRVVIFDNRSFVLPVALYQCLSCHISAPLRLCVPSTVPQKRTDQVSGTAPWSSLMPDA